MAAGTTAAAAPPSQGCALLQAAVEVPLTGLCDQMTALAEAADVAKSVPDLDGIAAWLEEAVCSALETAGMRQV